MNLTGLINLKERIALSPEFTARERGFILDAINATLPVASAEMHDPGNYLARIDRLWAFLSTDDGGEGLCAFPVGNSTLPMIAADEGRIESLKPIARVLATSFKKAVRLVKFDSREDVDVYLP